MTRTAKLTIILGTNGTGKTTMLRHILDSSPQRALVVTSHVEEWTDLPENNLATPQDFLFHDRQRHIIRRDYTIDRLHHFKQGILVLDDCKTFIGDKNTALEELLIARRQLELDIFYIAHGFTRVPPLFWPYYTDLILFKTKDNPSSRKNALLQYDEIIAAQQRINNHSDPHYYERLIGQ